LSSESAVEQLRLSSESARVRFLDSDSYYWLQAAPMPPKKKQAPSVTAVEDDCDDSEGSEECSDPEDDIADEDF
jgi:hypothetical protein